MRHQHIKEHKSPLYYSTDVAEILRAYSCIFEKPKMTRNLKGVLWLEIVISCIVSLLPYSRLVKLTGDNEITPPATAPSEKGKPIPKDMTFAYCKHWKRLQNAEICHGSQRPLVYVVLSH